MTPLQEQRIGMAWKELGRHATAKQVWGWLCKKYKYPGFKSKYAVAQSIKTLKARQRSL